MSSKNTLSIVLACHLPYIRYHDTLTHADETQLFQSISFTYIPLLQMLERLDADCVPFRLAIALSPTLAAMLDDGALIEKYLRYIDAQIAFGRQELERTKNKHNDALWSLAQHYHDTFVERRLLFIEKYEKNICAAFNLWRKKGRLEILSTAATHCFLPFYSAYPGNVQAQIETALGEYDRLFGGSPAGFWPPELGWYEQFDKTLAAYGFHYTIISAHTAALAAPPAASGSFRPLRTPAGIFLLVRDHYAHKEIEGGPDAAGRDGTYCDYSEDIGYKLDAGAVKDFLSAEGGRCMTGYSYLGIGDKDHVYDIRAAHACAENHARAFLKTRAAALAKARSLTRGAAVSLCAWNADNLGKFWREGFVFLEQLFRAGETETSFGFATPSEYLCREDSRAFQTVRPGFSSQAANGYGEAFLNKHNDWIYRHIFHATERMIALARRIEDKGMRERSLNQAARELLLAQNSDFARFETRHDAGAVSNEERIISHLRNFTTLYEALGGDCLSTKLLTTLEKNTPVFPALDYRMFRDTSRPL